MAMNVSTFPSINGLILTKEGEAGEETAKFPSINGLILTFLGKKPFINKEKFPSINGLILTIDNKYILFLYF